MALRKGCCVGGCLMKTLIGIVVIVLLIGGAILWFVNQTPASLGFDDYEISGTSIREMGLADTKIKALYSVLKAFFNVNEADIVKNPYDPVADKESADATFAQINLPLDGEDLDYLYLLENPLITENPELVKLKDTEIAYVLNAMVDQAVEGEEGFEQAEMVKEMNASFIQVTITKNQQEMTLEMMLRVDISSIREQIPVPFVGNVIPNVVYLNSINTLIIDDEGKISTTSKNVAINGMSDQLSTSIVNTLFASLAQEQTEQSPIEYFNDSFGELFRLIINNVGLVGDAELTTTGEVIENTIDYGEQGVTNHYIQVITRTELEEPPEQE